jgi:hypothetical protein
MDSWWATSSIPSSEAFEREGVEKLFSVTRQISVLAVTRIVLLMVQGPIPEIIPTSLYDDLFPLTAWPIIEVLFKSSLVVVFMVMTIRLSSCSPTLHRFAPEIERILYSLQFLFADTITPLISDYRMKRMICMIGFLFLGRISDYIQGQYPQIPPYTPI